MTVPASLPVVTFAAAGGRFAMPSRQVAGMRSLDGYSGPAPAIEDLLGVPRDAGQGGRLLMLKLKGGEMAVRVLGDIGMRELPASLIHVLPALVAARSRIKGLAALVLDQDGAVMLIEPGRLEMPGSGV
jgi:hypothetical protein